MFLIKTYKSIKLETLIHATKNLFYAQTGCRVAEEIALEPTFLCRMWLFNEMGLDLISFPLETSSRKTWFDLASKFPRRDTCLFVWYENDTHYVLKSRSMEKHEVSDPKAT